MLGNTLRIPDIILEGEVDFGFAGKLRNYSSLTDIPVHTEKLMLVASPHHYLASKKIIDPAEMLKTPFIWREKGILTQKVMKRWFEKHLFYFKGKKFSRAALTFLRMLYDTRRLSYSDNMKDIFKAETVRGRESGTGGQRGVGN